MQVSSWSEDQSFCQGKKEERNHYIAKNCLPFFFLSIFCGLATCSHINLSYDPAEYEVEDFEAWIPIYVDTLRGRGTATQEQQSRHLEELSRLTTLPAQRHRLLHLNFLSFLVARLNNPGVSRADCRCILVTLVHLVLHGDPSLPSAQYSLLEPLIDVLRAADPDVGVAPPRTLLADPALIAPFRLLLDTAAKISEHLEAKTQPQAQ
mmetsp:Transcript_1276/g.2509  ORF Transcript_1276/g.2509 Transcript_1276/m.2509 type:complete len:207 (+) Transcript_1276:218-838(+)